MCASSMAGRRLWSATGPNHQAARTYPSCSSCASHSNHQPDVPIPTFGYTCPMSPPTCRPSHTHRQGRRAALPEPGGGHAQQQQRRHAAGGGRGGAAGWVPAGGPIAWGLCLGVVPVVLWGCVGAGPGARRRWQLRAASSFAPPRALLQGSRRASQPHDLPITSSFPPSLPPRSLSSSPPPLQAAPWPSWTRPPRCTCCSRASWTRRWKLPSWTRR